jgi:lysophospholipase L1-like esterase
MPRKIILLGDSDISRWPSSLHPSIPSAPTVVSNYGKGGACLVDLLEQIKTLDQWEINGDGNSGGAADQLFVCCAGENDIGSGRTMEHILDTFSAVLDSLFPSSNTYQRHESKMIFFGPKFEPWMTDDNASRKKYTKLSNGFQRAVRKHRACDRIIYIDCLTLFCTKETSSEPGAVHGGRAMPDIQYFDSDGLHLNDAGYGAWKRIVEVKIAESGSTWK